MNKEDINVVLAYLKDFYKRTDIQAFKDCTKVMACDLKIKLKQLEQGVKQDA